MQNLSFNLSKDYMRDLHIGEVAFSYYQLQRSSPTEQDFQEWLSSLPLLLRNSYQTLAFEEGMNRLDFRRFFLELRKKEMQAYMQENLSTEDYMRWEQMRDTPEVL